MRFLSLSGMVGMGTAAIFAFSPAPSAAALPLAGSGSRGVVAARPPAYVTGARGRVWVGAGAVFRSRPAGPKIDVGYVLVRHRDPALPVARGTVTFNPGSSGAPVIDSAAMWAEVFADLLSDHDLLLIDSRRRRTLGSAPLRGDSAAWDPERFGSRARALRETAGSAGTCVHRGGHGR